MRYRLHAIPGVAIALAIPFLVAFADAHDHAHHGHGHFVIVAVPCPPSGARLFLSAAGEILLNGKAIAPSDIPRAIAKLKPRPTEICYAREKLGAEPRESQRAVTNAIRGTGLPLSLYVDRTFLGRMQAK